MKNCIFRLLPFLGALAFVMAALGGTAHAAPVPELDPSMAGSGVALLVGGAFLLIERYRRRR